VNSQSNARKKQRPHYRGKKKRHTQKTQVIIRQQTMQIIATAFGNGSTHDFRLFKESKTVMAYQVLCLADAGYQVLPHHTEIRYSTSVRPALQ
jgi:hypothetical protein